MPNNICGISRAQAVASGNTKHHLTVKEVRGKDIFSYRTAIAQIWSVFKEYPYLYNAPEQEHIDSIIERYVNQPDSIVYLAFDGETAVGVLMGVPVTQAPEKYREPFKNWDQAKIFYVGEMAIINEYRSHGEHGSLEVRSRLIESLMHYLYTQPQYEWITFCEVVRSDGDPQKPANYFPPDNLWRAFGFEKHPELTSTSPWHDDGGPDGEVEHTMVYWLRASEPRGQD